VISLINFWHKKQYLNQRNWLNSCRHKNIWGYTFYSVCFVYFEKFLYDFGTSKRLLNCKTKLWLLKDVVRVLMHFLWNWNLSTKIHFCLMHQTYFLDAVECFGYVMFCEFILCLFLCCLFIIDIIFVSKHIDSLKKKLYKYIINCGFILSRVIMINQIPSFGHYLPLPLSLDYLVHRQD